MRAQRWIKTSREVKWPLGLLLKINGILETRGGARAQGQGHSRSEDTAAWTHWFAEAPTGSRAEPGETRRQDGLGEGAGAGMQAALKACSRAWSLRWG